jgi:hypothetical protein
MAEPLSMDLRRRLLAAIAARVSGRSAGRRFSAKGLRELGARPDSCWREWWNEG